MCLRFVFVLITRVTAWLRLSQREDAQKTAEILILRHQLAVLQPRRPCRLRLNWADRALLAALLAVIPKARRQLSIRPDGEAQRLSDQEPAKLLASDGRRAPATVWAADHSTAYMPPAARFWWISFPLQTLWAG